MARSCRVLAFLAALGLAVGAAVARPPEAARHGRQTAGARTSGGSKVAIFGIDAADWRVVDRLVAAGHLPTFARLKQVATLGTLRADPPLLSPIIWTTVATGRNPEDHGVLDFMVDLPGGGQAPISGGARRTKAMWEIWSGAGRTVAVTGWWATWPADEVRGVMVADRIASPHLRVSAPPESGLVHPPARARDMLAAVVAPDGLGYADLARLLPLTRTEYDEALKAERESAAALYQNNIAHLRAAFAAARTYRTISTRLAAGRPDLWAVYYELVDTVSHLFVNDARRGDAAIRAAYEEMDGALADAARALDPDTCLLVVSDHGFQPPDAGIREDPSDLTTGATAWHRLEGIAAVTSAGALSRRAAPPAVSDPLGTISPLDILPSLLVRAGLPVAADMPGRIVAGLAGPTSGTVARVPSYGAHDLPGPVATDGAVARAELERLRALGYISGATAPTSLAQINLGEILYRRGDFRGAQRELEAVLRADPLSERGTMWLARTYVALGRPDDALRLYDRAIRAAAAGGARPLDPLIFLAATDVDLERGRVTEAAARLGRVPPALARAPEVLVAQGAVADAQGRTADAERNYRAALDAAPTDTDALERLAFLLIRTGRGAAAVALAEAAADRYPASPMHLSLAGENALAVRRFRDAERYFQRALALAPDSSSVRVELARARLLGERPDEALAALGGVTGSRDADILRGAARSKKNDWPGAVEAYQQALSAGPADVPLLNALGNAQLQAGRAADAIKTLERSLAMKADQPEIRRLLDAARGKVR